MHLLCWQVTLFYQGPSASLIPPLVPHAVLLGNARSVWVYVGGNLAGVPRMKRAAVIQIPRHHQYSIQLIQLISI